jgi:hypothetical protein
MSCEAATSKKRKTNHIKKSNFDHHEKEVIEFSISLLLFIKKSLSYENIIQNMQLK